MAGNFQGTIFLEISWLEACAQKRYTQTLESHLLFEAHAIDLLPRNHSIAEKHKNLPHKNYPLYGKVTFKAHYVHVCWWLTCIVQLVTLPAVGTHLYLVTMSVVISRSPSSQQSWSTASFASVCMVMTKVEIQVYNSIILYL